MRQSVVLALVIAFLVRAAIDALRPSVEFIPYWVLVFPKWYELLTDFKLIDSGEQWDALQKHAEKMPFLQSSVSILTHAVCFTVVRELTASEGRLIYWNLRHDFSSDVDCEEPIEPRDMQDLEPEVRERDFGGLDLRGVSFFMRSRGGANYDLGLIVPDSWWAKNRKSCPKPIEEDQLHDRGQVRLALAKIPSKEFDYFYWKPAEPWEWNKRYDKARRELGDLRDKQLGKSGWKREEHDVRYRSKWPESLEHKYFRLEHRGI